MPALLLLLCTASIAAARSPANDHDRLIAESIATYSGSCPCPSSTTRTGRTCGAGSGYSRSGGMSVLCYASDIDRALAHVAPPAPAPTADDLVGRASVLDGDTIEIRGTRIRLFGIDAFESSQLCYEDQRPWRCWLGRGTL
jgi:hypothetical protein